MKKHLPLIIIGILLLSSLNTLAITIPDNQQTQQHLITSSEPLISEKNDFLTVTIPEATTFTKNPGQPILPIITKTYTYPIGTIFTSISIQPTTIQQQNIDGEIIYAGTPVIRTTPQKPQSTTKDLTIYNSNELYPQQWSSHHIGVGLDRETSVTYLTIQLYPVRYRPQTNLLEYTIDFNINIQTKEPKKTIQTLEDEYDLVIIAPRIFSFGLKKLVTHKENMGVKTNLVTTSEIYQQYVGRDKQEQIKHFIQYAKEEWGTTYVLLFGGMKGQRIWAWHIPVRYSNLDDASVMETSYISDLYYSDLYKYDNTTGYTFDDWDSNGNDKFAEWNTDHKDILDMYPDIYVGRLPCRYWFNVRSIVNRIITYETQIDTSEWFYKMAAVAGDSFDDISWNTSTDYIEGQVETDHALSFMDGFEPTRIYVEGGDVNFSGENATAALSEGHGFVYFSGHGSAGSWATHPHGEFSVWIGFGRNNIKALTNGDKLPVLVVGGCHNCQFDVSILRIFNRMDRLWGEAIPKGWGWLYTTAPEGGSIATIGNTGLGYGTIGDGPDPPDEIPSSVPDGIPDCIQYLGGWMETRFFQVYNHQNKTILGETHATTLTDYLTQFPIDWEMDWDDHEQAATLVDVKTVQQWVLFGDPSLQIGGYNL